MRTYKTEWRQRLYDTCRAEWRGWIVDGQHVRTGFGEGIRRAFWNGYEGKPKHGAQKNLHRLTAYMAGRDTAHAEQK